MILCRAGLGMLACSVLLSGCSLFGDSDEPVEPPAELTDFERSVDVDQVWDVSVGPGAELLRLGLRPAVQGGRVFAAGRDGRVVSLDLASGKSEWTTETELRLSAGPGVGAGLVVVGSSDGAVVAIDAASGAEVWRTRLSGEVLATPAASRGVVVVRSVDGRLRGLDAADGTELWTVEQTPPRLSLRGNGDPVIAGDLVVAGFDNGRIAAYTLREGVPVWENYVSTGRGRTELERLADVDATPVLVGNDIYVVSYHGRLANVAPESGQVLWDTELSSHSGLGADWTSVYVTTAESEVVAVNRSSGAEMWRQDALRMRQLTAPVPFGQSVVVGDLDGYLHWLDSLTGEIEGRERAGSDAIVAAPVSAGEYLVVQDEDDRVYAFRAAPAD
ncbi:MAG: outer membrane protein assembly factor BamB [Gammaproteobacteria bacterium]